MGMTSSSMSTGMDWATFVKCDMMPSTVIIVQLAHSHPMCCYLATSSPIMQFSHPLSWSVCIVHANISLRTVWVTMHKQNSVQLMKSGMLEKVAMYAMWNFLSIAEVLPAAHFSVGTGIILASGCIWEVYWQPSLSWWGRNCYPVRGICGRWSIWCPGPVLSFMGISNLLLSLESYCPRNQFRPIAF